MISEYLKNCKVSCLLVFQINFNHSPAIDANKRRIETALKKAFAI